MKINSRKLNIVGVSIFLASIVLSFITSMVRSNVSVDARDNIHTCAELVGKGYGHLVFLTESACNWDKGLTMISYVIGGLGIVIIIIGIVKAKRK